MVKPKTKLTKPRKAPQKSGARMPEPRVDGDDDGLEPPFNMIAYNRKVKEFWDTVQDKIDSLSEAQCLSLIERQISIWDGHRDLAKEFARMVGESWDGATAEIVGSAVLRAVFSRMNAYDPIYRPAPGIIPMGEFDDCLVFYHTTDAQFEVFYGQKRQRFPALYNPLNGMDVEDMRTVTEVARKLKGEPRVKRAA
jgi:hypothetical protein